MFKKRNFCVTKSVTGFISISPDHGIEQESRELKGIGGLVGIKQNEKSLDKYFLIAPELSDVHHECEHSTALETCQRGHNTMNSEEGSYPE